MQCEAAADKYMMGMIHVVIKEWTKVFEKKCRIRIRPSLACFCISISLVSQRLNIN